MERYLFTNVVFVIQTCKKRPSGWHINEIGGIEIVWFRSVFYQKIMFLLVWVSVVVCSFCSISLLVSGLWQKSYLPFNAVIKLWTTTSTACTLYRISHAVFGFGRNLFQFSIIFLCSFVVSIYTPMCISNKKGDINNIFSTDMPFLPRFKFCLCLNKFI